MIENITQLGIAGLTLSILFFIVKHFISTINKKDDSHIDLTEKFIDICRENNHTKDKLSQAIDANTRATNASSDQLTGLMLQVIKSNKGRRT